jgi:nucleolar GTP-binding protein
MDKAYRRASRVKGKGTRPLDRYRNEGLAKINVLVDILGDTLDGYVKAFPSLDTLPPFYGEILDILVDVGALKHHLGTIDWARSRIVGVGRRTRGEVARARGRAEVAALVKGLYGRISSLLRQIDGSLEFLGRARWEMRRLPQVDPGLPTVVVAGAPNVGKSLLVRRMSTGRPAVGVYPFTTKRVTVGHFDWGTRRIQVIDTPGLLDRPMEERNEIERQAIAAIRHIANVMVFLKDPTETCGYSTQQQEALLTTIRQHFPDVPIIVANNKADLLRGPETGFDVSAATGEGVEELRKRAAEVSTSRVPEAAPPWAAGQYPAPSSPAPGPWRPRR